MGAWGGKKYEGLGMRDVIFLINIVIQHIQKTSEQNILPVDAKMILIKQSIHINLS